MAKASVAITLALVASACGGGGAPPAPAAAPGVVAFGDSITDEYFEDGYAYGQSWLEQLVARGTISGGPRGSWGEPRRNGFEFSFARFGNMSDVQRDAARSNEARITGWVREGRVRYGSLLVGNNDYAPWFPNFGRIYRGELQGAELLAFEDQVASNIREVVQVLKRAGAKPVLASFIDYSALIYTEGTEFRDRTGLMRVQAACTAANAKIAEVARTEGVPFFDLMELGRAVFGTVESPRTVIVLGGNSFALREGGEAATNGFVQDKIHPHSGIQAMLAAGFVEGFRRAGATMPAMSERDMAASAGLPYTRDSLPFMVRSFVR